ncbi:MAG: zinc ribbon domain-containing protein [Chloroflexi bacterium]|nr:zinc ribbon domain-containing protein [Chloroflexota bacterium]
MPIYEYHCNGCGKVASLFFRSFSTPIRAVCPSCNSEDMSKLMSRPVFLKSQLQRIDEMDMGRMMGKLQNPYDPGAAARFAEEMGGEVGGDIGEELRAMSEQVQGDERPPELYDAGYYVRSRLEQRRQELSGQGSYGGDDASGGAGQASDGL